MKFNHLLKAASLGVALSVIAAGDLAAQGNKVFGLGQPVTAEELPAGVFRDQVLSLEPEARGRAIATLQSAVVPALELEVMRADPRGYVYYVDPAPDDAEADSSEVVPPSEISSVDVFKLHSKPGAPNTLYVDFDGHVLQGTAWNTNAAVLDMLPFDTESPANPYVFTQDEVNRIAEAWRRVSEDFAPFDVDVTTEEPPYTIVPGGARYYGPNTAHALVTSRIDANGVAAYNCSCGGVAYLNSWGYYDSWNDVSYATGLSFNESITSNAMTISHETGHQLGLHHDSTTSAGYYGGHGSGETSWGPIMGAPFGKSVVTWSRDTYPGANQPEDDYSIIIDDIPFRADDHEDTALSLATPLLVNAGAVVSTTRVTDPSWANTANKGIIGTQTDVDLFSMNIGAGLIDLDVNAATYQTFTSNQGADLDIEVKLLDEFGTVLQTSNPDLSLHANITYNVTVPGEYYLRITGVGRGDPLIDGYTDYGIVGQFYINGTVPTGGIVYVPPTAPSDLTADLVGGTDVVLTWTDPLSTPESNETGYRVLRSLDGGAFVQVGATLPADSESYSDNNVGLGEGLTPGDHDYVYILEAVNSAGSDQTDAPHPTVTVTVDEPPFTGVAVATSESTLYGSIASGSYLSTQAAAGSETLSEEHSGGRPNQRTSRLDHSWFVTGVAPGGMVEIAIRAEAPANSEFDDFAFSYLASSGASGTIGTVVNGTGQQILKASLPSTTSGTVEINVVDTRPSTPGNGATDTLVVHEITITSSGSTSDLPPDVAILAPTDGASVAQGTSVTFVGDAADEDGDLSSGLTWISDIDGAIGAGASFSKSNLSIGAHVITASVSDSALQEGSATVNVTVFDPSGPAEIHVGDLDRAGVANGRGGKWTAEVTITVHDENDDPVSGATVSGSWSGGASGSGSCTTIGSGACTISQGGLKGNVPTATFTVTDVSGTAPYNPGANHDTDGDSDGSTITVFAP